MDNTTHLPSEEEVLNSVEEHEFQPGSEIWTTFMYRKIMWEIAQVMKLQGTWKWETDESDWLANLDQMHQCAEKLSDWGIKGVRLAVLPFEVTKDGVDFEWKAMDVAIQLMKDHNLKVDLCLGPFDYPYDTGIRLPDRLREELKTELQARGANHIRLSLSSENDPPIIQKLKEYAFRFLEEQIKKYDS